MTAEVLVSILGALMSLVFSYIPGISGWYDSLSKQMKQSVMGIGLVVVALGVFGIACAGLYDVGVVCDQSGATKLLEILFVALFANQTTYLITRK